MEILQLFIDATALGAVYCLITIGFSLTFTVGRFFDLNQGAAFLVGGYLGYFFMSTLSWPPFPSLIVSLVGAGIWGSIVESAVTSNLRRRNASPLVCFIATLGILILVQSVFSIGFGSDVKVYRSGPSDVFAFGSFVVTHIQLGQIAVCLGVVPLVLSIIKWTRFGKRLRAISDSYVLARTIGIPVGGVFFGVSILASTLSGMSGFIFSIEKSIDPTRGLFAVFAAVIASIVGGVGKISGAVLGAFFLSLMETIAVVALPGQWKHTVVYVVFIAFLSLRPQGLLGMTIRDS